MDNVADESRTNQGLIYIRDRYKRRAEYLLGDKEFGDIIRQVKVIWNCKYPRYTVRTTKDFQDYWPAKVMQDLMELVHTDDQRVKQPLEAWGEWGYITDTLCTDFFPPDDVATSSSKFSNHPALRFVCAALCTNNLRDLRGGLDDLFPWSDFELKPELAAERREILWAIQNPDLREGVLRSGYVVPAWPDLRNHDRGTA